MNTIKTLFIGLISSVSLLVCTESAHALDCANVDIACQYQCDQVNIRFQRVQDSCRYDWDFYWINYYFCRSASNAYNRAADAFIACLNDL